MQTKRIICPNCHVVLDVKNSQNEMVKRISCPSCHTLLQVKFPPQQQPPQSSPIDAPTYYASPMPPKDDSGKTQLAGANGETVLGGGISGATQLFTPAQKVAATAMLCFEGKEYRLVEGENIVGRKGNTSNATVQIETADRYMSRMHCSINVTSLSDGTMKAVLRNYQNKNQTVIDGHLIEKDDSIRLTDGNRITMGHTTVTFKLI